MILLGKDIKLKRPHGVISSYSIVFKTTQYSNNYGFVAWLIVRYRDRGAYSWQNVEKININNHFESELTVLFRSNDIELTKANNNCRFIDKDCLFLYDLLQGCNFRKLKRTRMIHEFVYNNKSYDEVNNILNIILQGDYFAFNIYNKPLELFYHI